MKSFMLLLCILIWCSFALSVSTACVGPVFILSRWGKQSPCTCRLWPLDWVCASISARAVASRKIWNLLTAPGHELQTHCDTGAGGFSVPRGVKYYPLQVPKIGNTSLPTLHTPFMKNTCSSGARQVFLVPPFLFLLSCTGIREGYWSSIYPGEQSFHNKNKLSLPDFILKSWF